MIDEVRLDSGKFTTNGRKEHGAKNGDDMEESSVFQSSAAIVRQLNCSK